MGLPTDHVGERVVLLGDSDGGGVGDLCILGDIQPLKKRGKIYEDGGRAKGKKKGKKKGKERKKRTDVRHLLY